MVLKKGMYSMEFRRWPREADASLNAGLPVFVPRFGNPEPEGTALAVKKLHIRTASVDTCINVTGNEKFVHFETSFVEGKTIMQAWFSDKDDKPLCGVFYAYIRKK